MEEIWKDIEGYPDYKVSNLGNVRGIQNPETNMTLQKNIYGYLTVGFGKQIHRVHRLVAKAFLANPNNLPQINHINHLRNDNRIDNLEWVDQSENNSKRKRHEMSNISYKEDRNRFEVNFQREGKVIYRKQFKTLEEAKAARDAFYATLPY
jgi:hypothetical protein